MPDLLRIVGSFQSKAKLSQPRSQWTGCLPISTTQIFQWGEGAFLAASADQAGGVYLAFAAFAGFCGWLCLWVLIECRFCFDRSSSSPVCCGLSGDVYVAIAYYTKCVESIESCRLHVSAIFATKMWYDTGELVTRAHFSPEFLFNSKTIQRGEVNVGSQNRCVTTEPRVESGTACPSAENQSQRSGDV